MGRTRNVPLQAAATPTELPGLRTIQHGSPIPTSSKEKERHTTTSNSKKELPTLGEGMGRGFRRFGEGHLLAAVFVPAKAGLFERPEAAFFYRRGGWRHAPHDGGDGGDDTEENSFSDSRRHRPRQGEAAIHHHGFLYLFHPPRRRNKQWGEHLIAHSASSNSDRVATPYYIYTQGRGAARLNPGP